MSKKKHEDHEEHVNHEAWVIPYADLMTLLMAMFIVLWALGTTEEGKAEQIKAGFTAELGIGPSGGSLNSGAEPGGTGQEEAQAEIAELQAKVGDAEAIQVQANIRSAAIAAEREDMEQAREEIQHQLDVRGLSNEVKLSITPEGLVAVATDGLLFAPGSAGLDDRGKHAIDIVAEPMRAMPQAVRIEGHTDSVPISSAQFPSNWELSTARSSAVLRYMVDRFGFPPGRLQAAGYADTHPVAPNDTAAGRAANRRVEIVLIARESTKPLQTGTDGVPGSAGVAGVPAPIGPEGPLGAPLDITPGLPTPKATPEAAAPAPAAAASGH